MSAQRKLMKKRITNRCCAKTTKTGSIGRVFVRLVGTFAFGVLCATPQGAAAENADQDGQWTFMVVP